MKKTLKYTPFFAIVVQLFLLVVTQFTAWPEMISWPYLMGEGWLPYKDIAIAHTPLLFSILSLWYKFVGVGVSQLQVFTWGLIVSTTALVWYVSNNLFNKKTAVVAVLSYPLLQILYEGNGLWFDLALAPLFLIIFYLVEKRKYISAGGVFGVAILTKQTSFWLAIPVAIRLFSLGSKKLADLEKRYVPLLFGVALSILTGIIFMYVSGVLGYFAHWAIEFGVFTLPRLSGQINLPTLMEFSKAIVLLIPFTVFAVFSKNSAGKNLFHYAFFALMGIFPRWELFHFQPALPFVAIATALAIESIHKSKLRPIFSKAVLSFFVLLGALLFVRYMIIYTNKEIRFYESSVKEVSGLVNQIAFPKEEIYVANYWDSLYAFTSTSPSIRPLVPYIPWYLNYKNLDQFIEYKVKEEFPKVIVRGRYGEGLDSYSIDGLEDVLQKYYSLHSTVENVDIFVLN